MKKYFSGFRKYSGVILACCFYPGVNVFSQIIVSPGGAPSAIVNSFVSAGLLVSNIQLNCGPDTANAAYGTFSNGSLGLGLSHGIVLSTGSASNLIGPNFPGDSSTTGTGSHNGYQDPQLAAIAGDTISDLCALEFDVVPHCNSLQIKFVFGSEEYPEYVNAYNDAFGFFVTGPDGNCNAGFYDNTNVAKLPDGTPISVNNVNDGFSYGCPAVLPGPCQHCSYYINNCSGTWVEYDGFTTVITVNLSVCPCATYHWKFAIADTRDALYDSGVMIETFACQSPLHTSITSSQTGCNCTGTASVNILNGTPPYSFLWSEGQTTQTVTNLCAGYHSVQVMDVNSCNMPVIHYVLIEELGVIVNSTNVTCHEGNNGSAVAFVNGGNAPYSFVWSTNPPQVSSSASNLTAGTYTVNVTDSSGCSASASVIILQPDTFFILVNDSVHTSCQLNNGFLQPLYSGGTNPLTYLWSTNPPQTSSNAFGLAPGIYTVTATDANGCMATASSTVLPSEEMTTGGDITICQGDNVLIYVYGANNYVWSPPNGLYNTSGSFQYAHPIVTTTYTIVGYCSNGPYDTTYIMVTVIPSPVVTTSPAQYVCHGSDVTLQASGALHYSWAPDYFIVSYSPDSSSIVAHPSNTVNFVVTGYNSQGCSNSTFIPVTVQENNQVTISSTGPTIFCEGDETNLYVTGQGNYLWSTGETTQAITVAASGTYSVTVTDIHGCTSTSLPVLVVVYPAPVPLIVSNGPTEYCAGDTIALDLNVSLADHYLWNTLETAQTIHVTSSGVYSVTVTDNRNCTGTAVMDINLHHPSAVVNIYSGPALCDGHPALLYAVTQEGNNFLWSNGSVEPSILVYDDGIYSVTVTDIYSCSSTASVTLDFNPPPEAVISPAGPVLVCSNLFQALQANSGPGFSYQWFRDNQMLPAETNQELTASGAGSYAVRVTDAIGCSATSSHVEVMSGTGPEVSINASSAFGCRDNVVYAGYGLQNVTLTAISSSAVSYLWSTGETTQTISVNSAGTFSVTAFDAAGCPSLQSGQSQITITEVDIRCGHNLQKVVLCHVPEGNTANPQTICIAPSAVPAHLSLHQYDCLGPCPESAKISSGHDDHEVVIYPDPVKNQFTIYDLQFTIEKIEIFDALGQKVFTSSILSLSSGNGDDKGEVIDVSSFVPGIYFIKIFSRDEISTKKFVKAN